MPDDLKWCRVCQLTKPLEDFHIQRKSKDGRQPRCKPCAIAAVVQWQRDNPERHWVKQRRSDLKRRYGLTEQARTDLLASQNGRCAICGTAESADVQLKVDHCHTSGTVRGLLCHLCNVALGMFEDDTARLRRVAAYLDR